VKFCGSRAFPSYKTGMSTVSAASAKESAAKLIFKSASSS
jgi:hypothetical protein